MKLYAISDMHGNLDGLDPSGCDFCVIAGDFSKMTGFDKWHLYDQKKWIEKKFIPWARSFGGVEFVVVPGNHDLCMDPTKTACYRDLNWNIAWPDNVRCLIGASADVCGLKVYGTPYIPVINYKWAFESEHDELVRRFAGIPEGLDILVTHSPPRIPEALVDYSIQTQNGPFGSSELAYEIYAKAPKYAFCGHIHTGSHGRTEFGKSLVFNVSRLNEDYCVAYEPLVLDI